MAYYDPALESAAGNDPYTDRYESDPGAAADEPTFSPSDPAAPDSPADSFDDITTSTGGGGSSSNPPDNGGYTNPPRPDRTEGGESTNISGGADSNDPVSGGELDPGAAADEPTFSPSDPIVGIGEQVEEATGGSVSVNDFLDSVLKAGGSFSTGVGGTTEGQDLDSFNIPDELTQVPEVIPPIMPEDFPTANQPVSESGPSWLTFGVAAVVGIAGIAYARRSN